MATPCPKKVAGITDELLTEKEAGVMLDKMQRLAKMQAQEGKNYEEALRQLSDELKADIQISNTLEKRNLLLGLRARRRIKRFASQFSTPGEGLIAFMEGSSKVKDSARLSVDAQVKSIHGAFLGKLIGQLEKSDVLKNFKSDEISRNVYIEMGELDVKDGQPGKTNDPAAKEIARIIHEVTSEMVARQNQAGAYINRVPGYIVRQTHDMDEIRRAGGVGNGPEHKYRSFQVWNDFTLPLLDEAKTFKGTESSKFMHNVHEGLYSGQHGPALGEFETMTMGIKSDLAKKASQNRVLFFKDAESAWKYNQRFGTRSLRDQVLSDVFYRARSIALMENFGPKAGENFERVIREMKQEARTMDAAAVDSLDNWRIQSLFDILTGKVDNPVNHTLARAMNTTRAVAILSKMGGTLINALSDKAFMNAEYAYQGIGKLDAWASQLVGMGNTPERTARLRMMGVALDGIIGSTISRYTTHTNFSGKVHRLQQKLFDLNFMNWWTDTNKGAAAELMSAHLAEHSKLPYKELPQELSRVLYLYGIKEPQWNVIRESVWSNENGHSFITPDQLSRAGDESIVALLKDSNLSDTPANRKRILQDLDTQLRTYFSDRVDFAVPTPGASEKKWVVFNTQAGTPLGEGLRTLMMFKSFPLSIITKILQRDVYGRGADSFKQWLKSDHKGKFHVAQLIAMTTVAGYMSGVVRDLLKGREPKPLLTDGKINYKTLADAAARGGGAGILGDFIFNEYDRSYRTLTGALAGPVFGQLDPLAETMTLTKQGEFGKALDRAGKLSLDNTPFINLFYLRPLMDYFVFWNLQEMLDPGSLSRIEKAVETKNQQGYWLKPSETVK